MWRAIHQAGGIRRHRRAVAVGSHRGGWHRELGGEQPQEGGPRGQRALGIPGRLATGRPRCPGGDRESGLWSDERNRLITGGEEMPGLSGDVWGVWVVLGLEGRHFAKVSEVGKEPVGNTGMSRGGWAGVFWVHQQQGPYRER